VDWTSEDSWLYVYLGEVECDPERLQGGTCPFLIASETQTPKPKFLESDILPPQTYYLYIYNVPFDPATGVGSDNREAVSIVIGLTVGFGPEAAAGPALQIGPPTVVSPSGL
jgi:hypothetical protein